MKVKFDSDDELQLNKAIEIPSVIIVVRAIFLELKEIDIKSYMCYYFDDIIGFMDADSEFDPSDTLLDEKLYKKKFRNILIYDISYKTSAGAKPFCIRFNKIDGFIKTYNGIRCLALLLKFAVFFSILSYFYPPDIKRSEALPLDHPLDLCHGPAANLTIPPDPPPSAPLYCRTIL